MLCVTAGYSGCAAAGRDRRRSSDGRLSPQRVARAAVVVLGTGYAPWLSTAPQSLAFMARGGVCLCCFLLLSQCPIHQPENLLPAATQATCLCQHCRLPASPGVLHSLPELQFLHSRATYQTPGKETTRMLPKTTENHTEVLLGPLKVIDLTIQGDAGEGSMLHYTNTGASFEPQRLTSTTLLF
uniref:Uncharacterized protein n=1 Tax=Sphaerodactylus townsendi TaxID=933632 RepID=A0ACB8F514_9SAUR